jgi:hypothetical protein
MSVSARISVSSLLACAAAAVLAPAANAGFGVSLWEAGTCVNHTCTYASVEANHKEAFTQAAGHPPWGMTTFELNSKKPLLVKEPEGAPLKRVRVDVSAGLASDPQAPPKCSIALFKANACPAETEVGTNELEVFKGGLVVPVTGQVYNLEPEAVEEGLGHIPLLFGIRVQAVGPLVEEHVFLKGFVSWAKEPVLEARLIPSGDYHEYFEIDNINKENSVLRSKLNFNGHAGGNFITLPSECSSTTTNYLELESWTKEIATAVTHTPIGVEGCAEVPFAPTVEVKPATSQSDEPDGATTEVKVPQKANPEEINSSDIKDAHLTLPEGLTLNAAAARGLAACSPAQIAIGSSKPVECPAASKVGEVTIEADLPEKSLTGALYLGAPAGVPIKGPPYAVYLDAESPTYGISVRLQGEVKPDPVTGRLETVFLNNPQQPASDVILKLKGGPQAPLANPLACTTGHVESSLTPYTALSTHLPPALTSSPFTASGCASPIPFSLAQSTQDAPATAGSYASYTFNLGRAPGQQYLARVSTTLPAGLVGVIPSVALCAEAQAQAGTCASSSQIGTAKVTVGAGSEPYEFAGPVFLTGPYGGSPFGLSIPVPAAAGPFDLGNGACDCIVTRAAVNVDPYSGRVITTTTNLPTIVGGVPLRLRSVSVAVNRSSFLLNPTNCGVLSTNSTFTSTFNATQLASTPFQVSGCGALAFKPTFTAATSAKASRAAGASLQVSVTQGAHQANIRSVFTQLPLQLPSRLSTLQQACAEATFAANPLSCPAASNVGTATASTPVLPGHLSGPAYLVSHGGASFPDLDIVLEDAGVRVILVGNTNIKNGITTSNFASIPDVPVSSFSLTLPMGPHSALAAYGDLCASALVMPTIITAQNGAQIKQNTQIAVSGCSSASHGSRRLLRILRRRVVGHRLLLTVRTFAPGRLSAAGRGLRTAVRRLRRASTVTLSLPLTGSGLRALRHHRPLKVRVNVTLSPLRRGGSKASVSTLVMFRR